MTEQMIAGMVMLGIAALLLAFALLRLQRRGSEKAPRTPMFAGGCLAGLSLMFLSFGLSYVMQMSWLMEVGCVFMLVTLLWALAAGIGSKHLTPSTPSIRMLRFPVRPGMHRHPVVDRVAFAGSANQQRG